MSEEVIPASTVISVFQMMTKEILAIKDSIQPEVVKTSTDTRQLIDISEHIVVNPMSILNFSKSMRYPGIYLKFDKPVVDYDGKLHDQLYINLGTTELRDVHFDLLCKGVFSYRERCKLIAN